MIVLLADGRRVIGGSKVSTYAVNPDAPEEGTDIVVASLPPCDGGVEFEHRHDGVFFRRTCGEPIAFIDSKGYVYCAGHKIAGRGRRLTRAELATLAAGGVVARY